MNIVVSRADITALDADLIAGAVFAEGKLTADLQDLDAAVGKRFTALLKEEDFDGKTGSLKLSRIMSDAVIAGRVAFVGMGDKKKVDAESIRRYGARAVHAAHAYPARHIAISLQGFVSKKIDAAAAAQALTEGMLLGQYHFLKYKSKETQKEVEVRDVTDVTILAADAKQVRALKKGVERGRLFATATATVRDLVNEPASHMKPKHLKREAENLAKLPGIVVNVMNEADAKKLGMGSFMSVAQGSEEEGYMIHLSYKPRKKASKKIALVGKGITFDSGGLSLKPASYMTDMKTDMAGAAVVLGVFSALSELKPDVEVHGVMACTENMPSGKATRPGDVVTAYNGKTIEILNTDAEGRLVLADALAWAEDTIKPDMIIDYATLTGAAIVALGQDYGILMGSDSKVTRSLLEVAEETGEPAWELPLVASYKRYLKSHVADLANISSVNWAGVIMAGLFLNEFVKETPWVHIDLASPAWIPGPNSPYTPKGGTGYGVRTTLEFLDKQ